MTLSHHTLLTHLLALSVSFIALPYLTSCQDHEKIQESTLPLDTSNLSPTPKPKPNWRNELERISKTLGREFSDQRFTSHYQLKTLEQLAIEHPELAPHFHLQRAHLLFSRGQMERAIEISKALWRADDYISSEARLLVATNTQSCLVMEEALEPSAFNSTHEQYLMLQWRKDSHCGPVPARLKSERALARAYPKRFQHQRLHELFRDLSISKTISLALAWEKNRAPLQAILLLIKTLDLPQIDDEDRWMLSFERERIQVERLRSGYIESIKRIKVLARAKKKKGREAQILLGKAYSKAGQQGQAQKVYRGLIKEWEHSPEAKTARFNLAFSLYEQKKYRQARELFALLCRHRGEIKALERFQQRAPRKDLSNAAEWYFAWTTYLSSPRKAAPFLEALIGKGAPLSSQGRRAAYWAAKAYASHKPKRAAELRIALLNSDYRDWYSLLLRAEDPSLAADHKPWPLMPPLPPAYYQQYAQAYTHSNQQHPSLDPSVVQLPSDQQELEKRIERLSMRRQVSMLLGQDSITDRLDQRLSNLAEQHLKLKSSFSSWAVETEQYKVLHQWMLSQSPSKLREIPTIDDHKWWRSVFPLAFEAETHHASQQTNIPQEVLLSFIYKESAYAPRAVSHAYAMGLMQLLEKTAQALHPDRALPDLLKPSQNILLGAEYLAALSTRYHDQLPLIAAAYNAGPQSLNLWLKRVGRNRSERKLDLFIELIPFKEAREYVKRLTAIHCTYQYLYGQQSINTCANSLPLTLNTNIEPGINF